MDKEGLSKSELIGRYIVVVESKNKANKGQKGMIIDETKNCFVIENEKKKKKKLIKDQCVFGFEDNHDRVYMKIDGVLLVGRPQDRVKSKVKNGERN